MRKIFNLNNLDFIIKILLIVVLLVFSVDMVITRINSYRFSHCFRETVKKVSNTNVRQLNAIKIICGGYYK